MLCPKCHSLDDKVIDSRLCQEGERIRRRRECLSCCYRFTTYEEIEQVEFLIVKRDGRREPFDRQKLLSSLIKACEKRPIALQQIEQTITQVLHYIYSLYQQEISTKLLGDQMMKRLRLLDPIAYVRYASVYRAFQEVGEFLQEIQSLEKLDNLNDCTKASTPSC
ncbi:MAG: transcriptional regulator NrdR [Chthoniobacterales bacterium]|nr:transcriptional regulator NrdR [Chthoniobacterales bacterium]